MKSSSAPAGPTRLLSTLRRFRGLSVTCLALAALAPAHAQTRTWSGASSSSWNATGNWSGSNVPNATAETAAFGTAASNRRSLTFTANTNFDLGGITFNAGADAFIITLSASTTLRLNGAGIVNNSGNANAETLTTRGELGFYNSASAGNANVTLNTFASSANAYTETTFNGSSTAGSARLVTTGSATNALALLTFNDTATAGSATLTTTGNNGGYASVDFYDHATAGSARLTVGADGQANFNGNATAGSAVISLTSDYSMLNFNDSSTAGSATVTAAANVSFTGNASAGTANLTMNSSFSSLFYFSDSATAGNAHFTLNDSGFAFVGASTAASATIRLNGTSLATFEGTSTGGNAALILQTGAVADFSATSATGLSVGSIAGNGTVYLGANQLKLGSDGTSTTFSGRIHDAGGTSNVAGGGLEKTGVGILTLSGANTYTGGTTISFGTIATGHTTALGTGPVSISGATSLLNLAGTSLANAVSLTEGGALTGSGSVGTLSVSNGGTVSPGNSPGTINAGTTTFGPGGNYIWEINNATGLIGTHTDLLAISGALNITATSASPFAITLTSLLADNSPGAVINFNASVNSSYTIASATGGIFGFSTSAFTLNTAGFTNALNGGTWSLALGNAHTDLNLTFTASAIPEPSTYAALAGLAALALAFRRRRLGK